MRSFAINLISATALTSAFATNASADGLTDAERACNPGASITENSLTVDKDGVQGTVSSSEVQGGITERMAALIEQGRGPEAVQLYQKYTECKNVYESGAATVPVPGE